MKYLALLFLLTGCVNWEPYAEAGIEYPLTNYTDYWTHPDRSWQCDPPNFHGEIGMESENKVQIGLYHVSTVKCGDPFNNKPEIYRNGVKLTKRWGGQ